MNSQQQPAISVDSAARTLRAQSWLTRGTAAFSILLVAGLYAGFLIYDSQLALAQAADSLMDAFTGVVLAWTVVVAARPSDSDHPFGHTRAEPIGALVAAVLAGVLAIEVARSAIGALSDNRHASMDLPLAWVFGAKTCVKLVVMWLARRLGRQTHSPAIDALWVDARNDVLVSLVALVGFAGAHLGAPALDAVLALPVAVWIAAAGVSLAHRNVRLLMGEAPPESRQRELLALAALVPGVLKAHELRAHFLGTQLQVSLIVVVDRNLSLLRAHDIEEAVRARLEAEADVANCSVHVDIE